MFKVKITIANGEVVVYSRDVEDLQFKDQESANKFGLWFKGIVEFLLQSNYTVRYSYEVIKIEIDSCDVSIDDSKDGEFPVENTESSVESKKEDNRCKLGKNRDIDDCNGCLCDQCYGNQINGPIAVCTNCNTLIENVNVLNVKRVDGNYYCPRCSVKLFESKGAE